MEKDGHTKEEDYCEKDQSITTIFENVALSKDYYYTVLDIFRRAQALFADVSSKYDFPDDPKGKKLLHQSNSKLEIRKSKNEISEMLQRRSQKVSFFLQDTAAILHTAIVQLKNQYKEKNSSDEKKKICTTVKYLKEKLQYTILRNEVGDLELLCGLMDDSIEVFTNQKFYLESLFKIMEERIQQFRCQMKEKNSVILHRCPAETELPIYSESLLSSSEESIENKNLMKLIELVDVDPEVNEGKKVAENILKKNSSKPSSEPVTPKHLLDFKTSFFVNNSKSLNGHGKNTNIKLKSKSSSKGSSKIITYTNQLCPMKMREKTENEDALSLELDLSESSQEVNSESSLVIQLDQKESRSSEDRLKILEEKMAAMEEELYYLRKNFNLKANLQIQESISDINLENKLKLLMAARSANTEPALVKKESLFQRMQNHFKQRHRNNETSTHQPLGQTSSEKNTLVIHHLSSPMAHRTA